MHDRKKINAAPNRIVHCLFPLFLRVHFIRFTALVLGFTALSLALHAQDEPATRRGSRIIDDTTKQIYGPNTARYYYEQDAFFNRATYHPIDTVIRNFHRYTYVQQTQYTYQDLGNIGTAMNPIFYKAPEVIGVTSGFQAYDLLWDTERIRYYDTKSPYTNMKVILGGKGRSITRAVYSRNIKPRWNFGINYRGLFIDKQVQRLRKGDRNVRSTYYDAYTSFASKDSTYRLFLNFRRNKQEADEYGGVQYTPGSTSYDYFFQTNAQPYLTNALSTELRRNLHLMHEYDLGGKALQVYHVLDQYKQTNQFSDQGATVTNGYYDNVEFEEAGGVDADENVFKSFRNEAGVKGTLLKLFYNGYYAMRTYNMNYKYLDTDTTSIKNKGTEVYLGGRMSLKLDSLVEVTGWGEVMQTGNFRVEGRIKSQWFEATVKQMQYAPTMVQTAYRGSHDYWQNEDFHSVNLTQLNGYIHYNKSRVQVSPGLTFTRLGNYVFYKQDIYDQNQRVLPVQATDDQVILSPELRIGFTFLNHVHLRGRGIYSKLLQSSQDAIQLPELFVNGQLAYENIFFNGNFDIQVGVDVHWQSTYNALRYDVPVQQFYVQNINDEKFLKVNAFPIVDVFLNAKIKRGRIFVKMNNVVQLATKEGYLSTPYYPGQRNILDFGFDWSFYD